MELPAWLKIGSLIGKLDFSGWFRGWSKQDNKQYIQTQINIGSIGIYGNPTLEPVSLEPEQNKLCDRLDEWYTKYNLNIKPSEMFKGAIFAMRPECRNNNDWVAQVAHSLREILYPFGDNNIPNKEKALEEYGSVRADGVFTQEIGRIFGSLTELAHHGNCRGNGLAATITPEKFEQLVSDFQKIMLDALTRQIDVHREIDTILNNKPEISL